MDDSIREQRLSWELARAFARLAGQPPDANLVPADRRRAIDQALAIQTLMGEEKAVAFLLACGADPNSPKAVDKSGKPAVVVAAAAGRADILLMLDAAGAKLDALDREGEDAANWAARCGHIECLRLLAGRGVDLRSLREAGKAMAPLHWAVARGRADCVEFLLGVGADPEVVRARGLPPDCAAALDEWELARELAGAEAPRSRPPRM